MTKTATKVNQLTLDKQHPHSRWAMIRRLNRMAQRHNDFLSTKEDCDFLIDFLQSLPEGDWFEEAR